MTRTGVVVAAGAAAAIAACDGGSPVARGFGSQQLLPVRDPAFSFEGSRGDLVLYSMGNPKSYWSIDLRDGTTAMHSAGYADVPAPNDVFPSDPKARFHCFYGVDANGHSAFIIDDGQTGQIMTIDGVTSFASPCPTEADPTIRIWRLDDAGRLTLWTGPYQDPQMAPIDLVIVEPLQAITLADTAVAVMAARPSQPDAIGIYSIDMATFAVTELVPPVLANGAWTDGASPSGALESSSLAASGAAVWRVGEHFFYWRAMADGGQTLFVGPVTSGPAPELALFRQPGSVNLQSAIVATSDGTYGLNARIPPVWEYLDSDIVNQVLIWDDVGQRLLTCTTGVYTVGGIVTGDRNELLLFVPNPFFPPDNGAGSAFAPNAGPLVRVDLTSPAGGSAACSTIAPASVSVAGLSSDQSTLFYLVQQAYPDEALWLAAPDGSAPHAIGTDLYIDPHFVGPSRLEVQIRSDLLWIDVHDDPIVAQGIAERVSGTAIDHGGSLVIGYDRSEQDGTARLGVVDRASGNPRLISPDVVDYFSPDRYDAGYKTAPAPLRSADDPTRIVYLVRGRNPSAQDGIWVATLNAQDWP